MNKEQWKEITHEIVPHLEAIRKVVEHSGIDALSMYSNADGKATAFYIDDIANISYDIEIDEEDMTAYRTHRGDCKRETIEERPHRPASLGRSNKKSTILSDI